MSCRIENVAADLRAPPVNEACRGEELIIMRPKTKTPLPRENNAAIGWRRLGHMVSRRSVRNTNKRLAGELVGRADGEETAGFRGRHNLATDTPSSKKLDQRPANSQ